jgi:hypothetical protein
MAARATGVALAPSRRSAGGAVRAATEAPLRRRALVGSARQLGLRNDFYFCCFMVGDVDWAPQPRSQTPPPHPRPSGMGLGPAPGPEVDSAHAVSMCSAAPHCVEHIVLAIDLDAEGSAEGGAPAWLRGRLAWLRGRGCEGVAARRGCEGVAAWLAAWDAGARCTHAHTGAGTCRPITGDLFAHRSVQGWSLVSAGRDQGLCLAPFGCQGAAPAGGQQAAT